MLFFQVPLDGPIQQQIEAECSHLGELSELLADLEVAIGFLASVGGEPSMPLAQYMNKVLQMTSTFCSNKVWISCNYFKTLTTIV